MDVTTAVNNDSTLSEGQRVLAVKVEYVEAEIGRDEATLRRLHDVLSLGPTVMDHIHPSETIRTAFCDRTWR